MNERHEANRRDWDANARSWRDVRNRDGLWRRCPTDPDVAFQGEALALIRDCTGDLRGKDACVVGSGDNYAAFALAGLGSSVTSVDISRNQLDVASERARELGLQMTFIRSDAAELSSIADASFDLVFSSNGFFVWIEDLAGVFGQLCRVLRAGGHYVFYDIHPFQRPWQDQVEPLKMAKDYWTTGPFVDEKDGTYEYNWTLADLLNPMVEAGLVLRELRESPPTDSRHWEGGVGYEPGTDSSLLDWRCNPRAGLPVWLTVAARKP